MQLVWLPGVLGGPGWGHRESGASSGSSISSCAPVSSGLKAGLWTLRVLLPGVSSPSFPNYIAARSQPLPLCSIKWEDVVPGLKELNQTLPKATAGTASDSEEATCICWPRAQVPSAGRRPGGDRPSLCPKPASPEGPSGHQRPAVPLFLVCRKSFSHLALLWIPKDRLQAVTS